MNARQDVIYRLKTLKNELDKELLKVGQSQLPEVSQLTIDSFNLTVYERTTDFLKNLQSYYNLVARRAQDEKKKFIAENYQGTEGEIMLQELKEAHENEAVGQLVRNTATENRIMEDRNQLIQKIYPIYLENEYPKHPLDFRAQFYTPTKYFAPGSSSRRT